MEIPDFSQIGYVAPVEFLNQLRHEYGSDPAISANAARSALEVEQALLRHFGQFMRTTNILSVADRIITVDRKASQALMSELFKPFGGRSTGNRDSTNAYGACVPNGRFIVFYPPNFKITSKNSHIELDSLHSGNLTDRQINSDETVYLNACYSGSLDEMKRKYDSAHYVRVLSHEIAHYYGSLKVPWGMEECGAHYFSTAISEPLLKDYDHGYREVCRRRDRHYANLIGQFGDDVHRVFFGKKVDPKTKEAITAQFTEEEMSKLFPGIDHIPWEELQVQLGPEEPFDPMDSSLVDISSKFALAA